MNDAELIGFATLIVAVATLLVAVLKLAAELKNQKTESTNQQTTMKLMMDYISIQRDAIAKIEKLMIQKNLADQATQELQREKQGWEKVIAAGKTIGWLYDRDLI